MPPISEAADRTGGHPGDLLGPLLEQGTGWNQAERRRPGERWTRRNRVTDAGADPSWSPDGRWISWIWQEAVHVASPVGDAHRVLVAADSTRPAPAFTAWMPDSRTLLYMAYDHRRQGSIWAVPAEGGTPRLLVRFDDPSGDVEAGDRRTDAIIAAIQADGTLWLGGTRWHGLRAMRISVSGWSTSEADVDASLAVIRRVADEVHGG